jgi:LacI family transcriptional regulator
MKDIARELGLSVVTISKVVRNHEDISPETRERVLRRMKELNYEPNPAARALVTGKTHLVGLIVPDLVHPFFAQVAKGLAAVLRNEGYGVVLASSEEDPTLEQQEISQMLARRLDVLIIASTQWTVESFQRINEQQRPYVLIDRRFNELPANFVGCDDVAIGTAATSHLVDVGCRRIAYIGGEHVSTAVSRLEGYRRVLSETGLTLPEEYVICRSHADDSADLTGYNAMKDLLRLPTLPDAVFCYNDPIAMGAMMAIVEAGLRIPEDIALIGAGNVRYAAALRVPLSSVDQQCETLGARAADLALTLIRAKSAVEPTEIWLQPNVIARASTLRNSR